MTLKNSILATLSYHDVFDYPLNMEEIATYLISQKAKLEKIKNTSKSLQKEKKVFLSNSFYYLKRRGNIVKSRNLKSRYSKSKLKRANFYANILKLLPTIKMVAISGALAMENSHRQDDIDLTIIASSNTIWTTRLLANLLLHPFRRKPNKPHTNNKACLNLFLDESGLKIKNQNLYTAHEVAQMKPIWERSKTYSRFIRANKWVLRFLPNWKASSIVDLQSSNSAIQRLNDLTISQPLISFMVKPLEALAKWSQLLYMRKKISTERIGEHQLFFHPKDTQSYVLVKYQKRLKKLGILR